MPDNTTPRRPTWACQVGLWDWRCLYQTPGKEQDSLWAPFGVTKVVTVNCGCRCGLGLCTNVYLCLPVSVSLDVNVGVAVAVVVTMGMVVGESDCSLALNWDCEYDCGCECVQECDHGGDCDRRFVLAVAATDGNIRD